MLPVIDDEYLSGGRKFVDKYYDSQVALLFRSRLGPAFVIQSMGYENFSYALCDDIYTVETFLDIYMDWVIRLIEKVRDIGFDFAWFADDIAFKTSLMFSPDIFRVGFSCHGCEGP